MRSLAVITLALLVLTGCQTTDYAAELKRIRPLAEQGDAKAQTRVGYMVPKGLGDKQGGRRERKASASPTATSEPAVGRHSVAVLTPGSLYFIDAHRQMDRDVDIERVVSLMDHGAFIRMLAIHVGGTFLCTREAVKLMDRGGSVITLSSIAGLAGWGPVHYASAKGAILGFTKAACRELGAMGIRINAIAPGVIDTPMTAGVDEALLAPLVMMTPLGRKGTAEEIAATALYLASDEAALLTGVCLEVDGGRCI